MYKGRNVDRVILVPEALKIVKIDPKYGLNSKAFLFVNEGTVPRPFSMVPLEPFTINGEVLN